MLSKNLPVHYSGTTKFLHWVLFILFGIQVSLAIYFKNLSEHSPLLNKTISIHVSIGVLILCVNLLMISARLIYKRPAHLTTHFQKILANIMHFLLSIGFLIMPISGILMSMLAGYDVLFFGIKLPNFFTQNESLAGIFHEIHEIFAWILVGLVCLHGLAAFYHHYFQKDNVLRRMLPASR